MNFPSGQLLSFFQGHASAFPQIAILVLLGLAAIELAEPRCSPVRMRSALFAFALALALTVGGGCVLVILVGVRGGSSPYEIVSHLSRVVFLGVSHLAFGSILLAGALSLRTREGYGPGRRLMPALDRCCLRRQYVSKKSPPLRVFSVLGELLLYFILLFAFSVFWLLFARQFLGAETSPELEKSIGTPLLKATALASIVLAPFYEEVVYRGFFMEWLLRQFKRTTTQSHNKLSAFAAIVITSAVWSLCHLGQIEPAYIKWVQIFGIGLVLGTARLRLGLEACILLHLLFNLGQIVAPILEKAIIHLLG